PRRPGHHRIGHPDPPGQSDRPPRANLPRRLRVSTRRSRGAPRALGCRRMVARSHPADLLPGSDAPGCDRHRRSRSRSEALVPRGKLRIMIPLHVHSNFSLLRGASTVEELVARAAELGYRGLALTDRDALYGTVRFAKACAEKKLQPIFGSEVTLANGHQLTLLAENQVG